jgi:hypothetical protein
MNCLEDFINSSSQIVLLVVKPDVMLRDLLIQVKFRAHNSTFLVFHIHPDTISLHHVSFVLIVEQLVLDVVVS